MDKVKFLSLLLAVSFLCPPNGSALAPFRETSESSLSAEESRANWLKRRISQLRLMQIDFYDQGKAVANYDQFAIDAALSFGEFLIQDGLFQDPPPRFQSIKHASIPQAESFEPFFKSMVFEGWYGRTIVFYDHAKKNYKAFKFLSEFEEPGKLVYESEWFEFIQKYKDQIGLKGVYPRPWLLNGERALRLKSVPSSLFRFFKSAIDKTNEEMNLDSNKTNDGLGYTVMAYEVDSLDYFRYLNDVDVSEQEFNKGLELFVHDTLALAKHGIVHTALISSMHDSPAGRRFDGGRHLWMIDVINKMENRPGVGRLHAWLNALKYSNVRLSGLADFAEFGFLDDMAWPNYLPSRHFEINLMRFDMEERRKLIWMSHLGDLLLVYTLFLGEHWRRENKWNWEKDESLQPLAEELKTLFFRFASELSFDPTQLEFLMAQVDWLRLSRQMALFMAEGDRYLAFLEEGRNSFDTHFAESVFGQKVRVDLSKDMTQARGYIQTEAKTGLYWSAFDLTFLERVLSRLSVKYKIKQGADFIGWAKLIRPYDNQSILPLLNSLKEENEAMYQEFLELLSPDLGPVNGPFPIQELVRALYIFTTAAMLQEPKEELYPKELFEFARPDIGVEIGRGQGAILNATYDSRTGKYLREIGVLRFLDEYDSQETIDNIKRAQRVMSQTPGLEKYAMKVLHIDEKKRFVYVALIDVRWNEDQIIRDPESGRERAVDRMKILRPAETLRAYLATSPSSQKTEVIAEQLVEIFLFLRTNTLDGKAYTVDDMNLGNYLVVNQGEELLVKQVDYADFSEVARDKESPFKSLGRLLQQVLFGQSSSENIDVFIKKLSLRRTLSRKEKLFSEMLYLLYSNKTGRQKERMIQRILKEIRSGEQISSYRPVEESV